MLHAQERTEATTALVARERKLRYLADCRREAWDSGAEAECAICCEPLVAPPPAAGAAASAAVAADAAAAPLAVVNNCSHRFHERCLAGWRARHRGGARPRCPICREVGDRSMARRVAISPVKPLRE